MIILVSTPQYNTPTTPPVISRWLATESANFFRLKRQDQAISGQANSGGFLQLTLPVAFTGNLGDQISVYTSNNLAMNVGLVTAKASPATTITTDIPWTAGMVATFLNNNTLRAGYYFEGRLTVNGILQPITVIASPDTKGIADLDVSGILRIMIATGKTGDYSELLMKEPAKSGKFTFEYRECWYGSEEAFIPEGNTWYYAQCVRSEEQGSNLHDYVATEIDDAPWLNSFEQPVYFLGLPFDLSFILPAIPPTSPATVLTITMKRYNSENVLIATDILTRSKTDLEGFINSLNINPSMIEDTAAYLTVEITTP
jgi:hypothetical protein